MSFSNRIIIFEHKLHPKCVACLEWYNVLDEIDPKDNTPILL